MPTQTFKILKETKVISEHVTDSIKVYNKIKKQIKEALQGREMTIFEIAETTGLSKDIVTYNLMTMLKYGDVKAGEPDEDDEYYYYKLNK